MLAGRPRLAPCGVASERGIGRLGERDVDRRDSSDPGSEDPRRATRDPASGLELAARNATIA
jgi:hypothetical protein